MEEYATYIIYIAIALVMVPLMMWVGIERVIGATLLTLVALSGVIVVLRQFTNGVLN